ncbi:hypothetical protein ACFV0R_12630, partial [Streptomyces sp. NPDC059578]
MRKRIRVTPVAVHAERRRGREVARAGARARPPGGGGHATGDNNDSLHRARAAGFSEAFTGNDTDNAPMLAVNT